MDGLGVPDGLNGPDCLDHQGFLYCLPGPNINPAKKKLMSIKYVGLLTV